MYIYIYTIYVAEQGMSVPNLSGIFKGFWSHFFVFALE